MDWFWYFLFYSFLGFLVEVVYVRLRGEAKRDRKCRLILPVCPVYGLGALAILLLPAGIQSNPLLLFPAAALACTGVEYAAGLFYAYGAFCTHFLFYGGRRLLARKICRSMMKSGSKKSA